MNYTMGRTFGVITKVHIIGGVNELYTLIRDSDRTLHKIADSTADIANVIARAAEVSAGEYYQKLVDCTRSLSIVLDRDAEYINSAEYAICDYVDRVNRVNFRKIIVAPPQRFEIRRIDADVNVRDDRIEEEIIRDLINRLENYCHDLDTARRMLMQQKNDIRRIWRDPQYDKYARAIDEALASINPAVEAVRDYLQHLRRPV